MKTLTKEQIESMERLAEKIDGIIDKIKKRNYGLAETELKDWSDSLHTKASIWHLDNIKTFKLK